jgi:sulfatase modifying factor 1
MMRWVVFAGVSTAAIAAVTAAARRDAADPARCGELVAMGHRCCAEGQREVGGHCVGRPKSCPAPLRATETGCATMAAPIVILGGALRIGAGDWEAEGRIEPRDLTVLAFALDSVEITEEAYGACIAEGSCEAVGDANGTRIEEPGRARTGLSRADAERFCAFRGGRLPTADEWAFAAAGKPGRRYPWGDTGAVCRRASWGLSAGPCAFGHSGPELGGAHPNGATPEGVHDLAGNVAEWVAGSPDDADGSVRGGSFAATLATDLRTWRTARVPVDTRSAEIGARCAYDLDDEATSEP